MGLTKRDSTPPQPTAPIQLLAALGDSAARTVLGDAAAPLLPTLFIDATSYRRWKRFIQWIGSVPSIGAMLPVAEHAIDLYEMIPLGAMNQTLRYASAEEGGTMLRRLHLALARWSNCPCHAHQTIVAEALASHERFTVAGGRSRQGEIVVDIVYELAAAVGATSDFHRHVCRAIRGALAIGVAIDELDTTLRSSLIAHLQSTMHIHVVEPLAAACPSLDEARREHLLDYGSIRIYMLCGEFARRLLELHLDKQEETFPALAHAIEQLYVDGDDQTRNVITVGLLEAIQNVWKNSGVDPEAFGAYLLPVSRKEWEELNSSWGG